MEDMKDEVKRFQSALHDKDFGKIKMLAHRIRGSGGSYGFDEITSIGARMEEGATNSDSDSVQKIISELKSYLERVKVVYV